MAIHIKGYKDGDNITLLNTIYIRPRFHEDTNKWDKGSMTIVYRDNNTGEKKQVTIDNPPYTFYMAKPDKRVNHNRLFIPKEDTDEITVPFIDLEKTIAELTGNENFYYENIRNRTRRENKQLHTNYDIFNSDMDIEDHYRYLFSQQFANEICSITKSFFDIEVDGINMKGDFPELGECPVNAISFVLENENKVYSFLLRSKGNPQIKEFEEQVRSGVIYQEINDFIVDAVGGWKQAVRFGVDKLEYNFAFYDEADELRMIQDLFLTVNHYKPDFLLAWNMSFDIPYLIQRIINLGGSPEEIICHPDFKHKYVQYYIDERHKNEFAERTDFATIMSYTIFLDQMIHFASRRKGQAAFTAFNLDYIGEKVAKVKKLDYKDITTNIVELPYKAYKTFVFYNIMDTIVQKCIERKTGDLEYLFGKCRMNNTRYSKAHRQTIYLVNRGCTEFKANDDFIIGNNTNKNNHKEEKFSGAFVGDPTKLTDYSKKKIFNHVINILDNLIDLDYASLYPSLLREFNMAPNTQIGMIQIFEKIWNGENRSNDTSYSRGGEFIENLHSHNWIAFCNRWMHLANFKEAYHDVAEYFNTIAVCGILNMFSLKGECIPGQFIPEGKKIIPAYEDKSLIIPGIFAPKKLDETYINEVITNAREDIYHRYI